MDSNHLIKQLKCLYYDRETNENCSHTLHGDNHDVLVQMMIEHIMDTHGEFEIDRRELAERLQKHLHK